MNSALSAVNILVIARLCTLSLGSYVSDSEQDPFSPNAVHRNRRSAGLHSQLCPPGVSRESCFVNQLRVYMRMQDNLLDPVSLRNIGKRSGSVASPANFLGKDSAPWSVHGGPMVPGNSLPESLGGMSLQDMLAELSSDDFRSDEYDPRRTGASEIGSDGMDSNDGDFTTVQKRQIICPNGMSRIKCYNNALAFYMRLLRTVKEK